MEGADHDEFEDCGSSSDAASLNPHSPIDAGPGPLQSGKQEGASVTTLKRRAWESPGLLGRAPRAAGNPVDDLLLSWLLSATIDVTARLDANAQCWFNNALCVIPLLRV